MGSYSLPSTLASCTMFPKYSLLLLQDNTARLARVRREPQLVGSGPSLATIRTLNSAVVGTGTFDQGRNVNFLGAIASPPRRACRWVWNRRYRKYVRICEYY